MEGQKTEARARKGDFHMHSLFSDGSLSINAIFTLAKERGLCALSVTDHDTSLGLRAVMEASSYSGIPFVPGIELTASEDGFLFHVLGYGIDPYDPALRAYSRDFLAAMNWRSLKQIHLMQRDGVAIKTKEFFQKAQGGPLYRAKFLGVLADHALLERKEIINISDAYFGSGSPYEVVDPFHYKSLDEICSFIQQAGGKIVLAHPGRIKKKNQALYERLITDTRLDGLEVYHHHNDPGVRARLLSIAAKRGLLITGGTDFHGLYQKRHTLPGDEFLPDQVFNSLLPLAFCTK